MDLGERKRVFEFDLLGYFLLLHFAYDFEPSNDVDHHHIVLFFHFWLLLWKRKFMKLWK